MNIVILAAGQGKRMRSTLPKVLHPIAGRPMLEHVLTSAKALGSDHQTVLVLGHGGEFIQEFLSKTALIQ
jgi:bifunctional UDP-N-acetylglucosamine pyrophosphorylase / glucosamine-1-phosphate N-acetyltransferase